MSEMLKHALAMTYRGWRVIPVVPGGKGAIPQGWTQVATRDKDVLAKWWAQTPTANVGVVCGRESDLIVIDVDDVTAAADVIDRLPITFTVHTPSGLHFYFRYPRRTDDDQYLRNVQGTDVIGPKVDVRAEGGMVVGPGSYNAVKKAAYEIANDEPLAEVPSWIVDALREHKKPKTSHVPMPEWTPDLSSFNKMDLFDRGRRLMWGMPAAIDGAGGSMPTWKLACALSVGLCLSDSEAMAILQEYSATKCFPPWSQKELDHKLRSAKTKCTLPRGFLLTSPSSSSSWLQIDPFGGADITAGEDVTNPGIHVATTTEMPEEMRKRVTDVDRGAVMWSLLEQVRELGGLCDSFSGWVINGADYPQPGLTIGSLLALGGAVSARRYTYRRLTGNIYVCSLAKTSYGKNRPAGCVGRVLREVWPATIGANDFSSTQSTRQKIAEATDGGTGYLYVLDEYGAKLKGLLDNKSTFQRELRALLLEMATVGTGTYAGATSLTRGGQDILITAPGLSVLGPSTPAALHDAVGKMALEDGFLGRHVFVEQLAILPMFQDLSDRDPIPPEVRQGIASIRDQHQAWHKSLPPLGSSDDGRPLLLYQPEEIQDEGGAEVLRAFRLQCDERRRFPQDGDVPPEILGRAAEHATRICIGLAVLRGAQPAIPFVDAAVARCAVGLVESSMQTASRTLRENAAESDWERKIQRFKKAVRDAMRQDGWAEWTTATRKCQALRANETNEITAQLLAAGVLEAVEEKTTGRPVRLVRLLN